MRAACGALSSSMTRAEMARSAGDLGLLGGGLRSEQRRGDEARSLGPDALLDRLRAADAGGRGVDEHRALAQAGKRTVGAVEGGVHGLLVGEAKEDQVLAGGRFTGSRSAPGALLHERFSPGRRAVPHGDGVARLAQVVGHGRAHGPRSEKSDLHGPTVVAQGGEWRKRDPKGSPLRR
jgi:hypothetical protein